MGLQLQQATVFTQGRLFFLVQPGSAAFCGHSSVPHVPFLHCWQAAAETRREQTTSGRVFFFSKEEEPRWSVVLISQLAGLLSCSLVHFWTCWFATHVWQMCQACVDPACQVLRWTEWKSTNQSRSGLGGWFVEACSN